MIEKTIPATVEGRYHVVEARSGGSAPLLVGCHGYGENGRALLEEMGRIPGTEAWTLCSVEALHRFYRRQTGDVVGSWMTKEGREASIEGNVRYLSDVVQAVRDEHGATGSLAFLGFSQGVAMAYRAALGCGFPAAGLIALAGDVPPEVKEADLSAFPPVLLGRGTGDGWYTEGVMAADLEALGQAGVETGTAVFEGGHEWTDAFRRAAGSFLERVREGRPA